VEKKYRNKPKGFFFKDKTEIYLRALWYAYMVSNKVFDIYNNATLNYMIRGFIDNEKEVKVFAEIVGYTNYFVLDKLRDDIEEVEGWTDEAHDLNADYQLFIGAAFDEVFNVNDEYFMPILGTYYSFASYYGVGKYMYEKVDVDTIEKWKFYDYDENYIPENLYAYHINKIYPIKDIEKVRENAKIYYSYIGMEFYEDAFLNLHMDSIENDLAEIYSRK
jgi:hypothetical protein